MWMNMNVTAQYKDPSNSLSVSDAGVFNKELYFFLI